MYKSGSLDISSRLEASGIPRVSPNQNKLALEIHSPTAVLTDRHERASKSYGNNVTLLRRLLFHYAKVVRVSS